LLDATLFDWSGRVWAVPLWWSAAPLTAAIDAGVLVIPIDTTDCEFQENGLVMLLRDAFNYEVGEIASLTDSALTLKNATRKAWQRGSTRAFPTNTMRMDAAVPLSRWSSQGMSLSLHFVCDGVTGESAMPATLYRGVPVLEDRTEESADIAGSYNRNLSALDNGSGLLFVDDVTGLSSPVQAQRWLLPDRSKRAAFKRLLFAMRGQLNELWIPTWQDDLTLVGTVGSAAGAIDVEWAGASRFLRAQPNRIDIRIELYDGTIFYRRTGSPVEVDADTERMTIDTALGRVVAPNQVRSISWLQRCRFDADMVEIAHETDALAISTINLRAIKHG